MLGLVGDGGKEVVQLLPMPMSPTWFAGGSCGETALPNKSKTRLG